MSNPSTFNTAAYGGEGWQQRVASHSDEIGKLWSPCGLENEWQVLRSVVLHTPGDELNASLTDPDSVQMLASVDVGKAQDEHAQLVQAYTDAQVQVKLVPKQATPSPNQMFCADLFAMTPEGVILARPASEVRAGEEIAMAHCLASLGVPILKTLTGTATFEGADLLWIDRETALLGLGLRTNQPAVEQITTTLSEINATIVPVDMPYGTMHLMGMLCIVDRDLAIAWPRRTPFAAVQALRQAGYEVQFIPEHNDFDSNRAFNFVTLGPRKILMVADNPVAERFYESLAIECLTTPAAELSKAAGAVGCLTGIVHRLAR